VPGGKAAYPSSVLMNVIPAHVAGVENIVMTVPAPGGVLNPVVLAAAKIAGVTEIFQIGGAQAIAALAYGTDTFPQVDMIVGPGNAYVASAKRQLFGKVGIDMVAGPSEILVIADTTADSRWVAMDLLSQAEHDEAARSILVTTDAAYADTVIEAVEEHLQTLPRQEIARKSWEDNGAVYVVGSWGEAITISNEIAPEHLEIAVEDAYKFVPKIRNAGAVFVGTHVPEALGDYMAGPSHVLPTSGTARFSSGLSVFSFLKRMSLIGCDAKAFSAIADDTVTLAQEEGLDAHALSVSIRKNS
jgi:histidinol dehydrogenase